MERVFAFCSEDFLSFEVCVHEHTPTQMNLKVAHLFEGKILSLIVSEDFHVHVLIKRGNTYTYRLFELSFEIDSKTGLEVREILQKFIC